MAVLSRGVTCNASYTAAARSDRVRRTVRLLSIVMVWSAIVLVAVVPHVSSQGSSSSTGDSESSTNSTNTTNSAGSTPHQIAPKPFPSAVTTFCDTPSEGAVRRWDNITLCIVVGGRAKILFYPNVDVFTLLQIVVPFGPNTTGAFDNQSMWFQAEYSQAASPAKYRQPQVDALSPYYGYVVPFWTLIITLQNGYVSTMEWDDGCFGCSGDQCVQSTCSINPNSTACAQNVTSTLSATSACDPKFFVSWYGTDRDGTYLDSAGERLSQFREYSINSAFTNAYDTASVDISPTPIKFDSDCGSDGTACATN